MYDFLAQNALYVVLVIVLMVWTGIFFYLLKIDRNIKKLEETQKG